MMKPRKVVCLCGSTRFAGKFRETNLALTLVGRIVLSIGAEINGDDETFAKMNRAEKRDIKAKLDLLHMAKIDMADEILVINEGGYIGDLTAREIMYAREVGKPVKFQWYYDGEFHGVMASDRIDLHTTFVVDGDILMVPKERRPWVDGDVPAKG